jgi:hypothetical protein
MANSFVTYNSETQRERAGLASTIWLFESTIVKARWLCLAQVEAKSKGLSAG